MGYQVSVILKNGNQYGFHLSEDEVAAFDVSAACDWIGDAFSEADLEPPSPAGKIMLIDQVMMLALERKPADWVAPTTELRKFLAAVVRAMGRPTVTIDLLNYRI